MIVLEDYPALRKPILMKFVTTVQVVKVILVNMKLRRPPTLHLQDLASCCFFLGR